MTVLMPRGFKVKDAADYLGISASKLRDLPIEPRKVGGNVLYDRDDLDRWFSAQPYRNGDTNGPEDIPQW